MSKKDKLLSMFPGADPGVVDAIVEALEIHALKHRDYNGKINLYQHTGVVGRFCDVWRKVIRLHNFFIQGNDLKVSDETIQDTALDNIVYGAMLYAEIKRTAIEKIKRERNIQ